ncbi:MAG TPA: hypothetical protein VFB16_08325 [Bauldia sp.]|nr:hypothetical protein [Bauldia sp.]
MKMMLAAGLCALAAMPALAADGPTVQKLLGDGYTVAGAFPSPAGPGVLLVKGDSLYMCFVAETPKSVEITTQYCKAVK